MPRGVDDGIQPIQIMQTLATVLPANTNLGALNGTVAINSRNLLLANAATWPALVLWEGAQSSARIYWKLWQAKLVVMAVYYARWDQTNQSLDDVWANVDQDIRRMKANIEDNPRLFVNGTRYALDVTLITLSPFAAMLNDKDYGFPVVERSLSIQVNIQPYTSAS